VNPKFDRAAFSTLTFFLNSSLVPAAADPNFSPRHAFPWAMKASASAGVRKRRP
jgi:hypothetical protein